MIPVRFEATSSNVLFLDFFSCRTIIQSLFWKCICQHTVLVTSLRGIPLHAPIRLSANTESQCFGQKRTLDVIVDFDRLYNTCRPVVNGPSSKASSFYEYVAVSLVEMPICGTINGMVRSSIPMAVSLVCQDASTQGSSSLPEMQQE